MVGNERRRNDEKILRWTRLLYDGMGEIMSATMAYMGLQAFSGLLKAQGYNAQGKAKAAAHQFNADIAYRNYEYSLIEAQQRKIVDYLQELESK